MFRIIREFAINKSDVVFIPQKGVFMRRIFSLCIILSLLVCGLCVQGSHGEELNETSLQSLHEKNSDIDKFEFAQAFIRSLAQVASMLSRLKGGLPENTQYIDEVEMNVAFMKNLRRGNDNLTLAINFISPFKNSKNKLIGTAVDNIEAVYKRLIELNYASINQLEVLYGPEVQNHPEEFDQGKFMRQSSEIAAAQDQAMDLLMWASVLVTNIVVSEHPDKEGKMSILALTKDQREKLLEELSIAFDDKIKVGFSGASNNLSYFESSGAILYQTLALTGFKSIDEK